MSVFFPVINVVCADAFLSPKPPVVTTPLPRPAPVEALPRGWVCYRGMENVLSEFLCGVVVTVDDLVEEEEANMRNGRERGRQHVPPLGSF